MPVYIFTTSSHPACCTPQLLLYFMENQKRFTSKIISEFFRYKCCFFKWMMLNGDLMKMQNFETEWIFSLFAHSFRGIAEQTWQNKEIFKVFYSLPPFEGTAFFPDPLGNGTSSIPHSPLCIPLGQSSSQERSKELRKQHLLWTPSPRLIASLRIFLKPLLLFLTHEIASA